jgi:hypothetical protein
MKPVILAIYKYNINRKKRKNHQRPKMRRDRIKDQENFHQRKRQKH